MTGRELLSRIPYELIKGSADCEVKGICHDNRQLKEGDAFVCIRGARFDTHSIIGQIAEKASLIVVEQEGLDAAAQEAEKVLSGPCPACIVKVASTRDVIPALAAAFYGYPSEGMVCVGITGSKGKTTCTHMLADIFRAAGYLTGTIGTNGAIIPAGKDYEVPGSQAFDRHPCGETPGYDVVELNNTTPDPVEMQMYLAMMKKAGCSHVVVEVSSQGMKQHRADCIDFAASVWTNIETGDHIGVNEHKDFEEYLFCKASLLNQSRRGYINCDDPHFAQFMKYITLNPDQITFYGTGEKADYRLSGLERIFNEEKQEPGIRFHISGALDADIAANLPGDFNMYNAAAAVAVAAGLGIDTETINKGLSNLRIRGRFDIVYRNDILTVCVDFAHNGYSTRNHLQALREYHPKRVVCVFGADGNRSIYRRLEMGEASARYADLSIVTAGHNRYETFDQILAYIRKGIETAEADMGRKADVLVIPNRQEAIRYAIEHAEPGDFVTILGLGHESYQEENGVKTPHSDIDYARKCCREIYG